MTEPECSESELPLGSESRESRSEHNPPPPRVRAPTTAGTRAVMRGREEGAESARAAPRYLVDAFTVRRKCRCLAVPHTSAAYKIRQDQAQVENAQREGEGWVLGGGGTDHGAPGHEKAKKSKCVGKEG